MRDYILIRDEKGAVTHIETTIDGDYTNIPRGHPDYWPAFLAWNEALPVPHNLDWFDIVPEEEIIPLSLEEVSAKLDELKAMLEEQIPRMETSIQSARAELAVSALPAKGIEQI